MWVNCLKEIIQTAKLSDNSIGEKLVIDNPIFLVTIDYKNIENKSISVLRKKDNALNQWVKGDISIDEIIKFIDENI